MCDETKPREGYICLFEECNWSYRKDVDAWVMPIPENAPCIRRSLIIGSKYNDVDRNFLIDALNMIKRDYPDNDEVIDPILERILTGRYPNSEKA